MTLGSVVRNVDVFTGIAVLLASMWAIAMVVP